MKKWKHINFEQRKTITSCISHEYKLKDIGNLLKLDPTSISKEVKRNRVPVKLGYSKKLCNKLNRWPYVCSSCKFRYKECPYLKMKYEARIAQIKADANLINSRKGLDIDSDEFQKIDELIKDGIDNNKSLYQIKIENNEIINKSITTLYRYVNKGYLTTKRIDLPYAVKYKKRKHKKKYEYSNNNIDRSNHTYLDYLAFIHNNPRVNVWQLDFLGSIKSDSKSILTFILPELHFSLIEIIKNPDSSKVVEYFDNLENKIGTENFTSLISVILTDRDPCFTDITGICFSKITGEERCKLFFCDPYVSNQKPNVENMNKQLRKFFPQKNSIDKYTKNDIKQKNITLLNIPLKSLDSYSSREAFIRVYGEDFFNKIF
jgi:transposase, IS30 family